MRTVRTPIGTERQVETALEVLAKLSEQRVDEDDLRDAIGLVRSELRDVLDPLF
jgi:benzoyl-CoA reductase/2-hydroxyglutaryl-CoA dehydratase subunit BcrC/BadD/HgdB